MFKFSGGALSIVPESDGHWASFELFNAGDESGVAEVGVEVDGNYVTTWTSGTIAPNVGETPSVSLGAVGEGNHEALVYVNPGSGENDHLRQAFTA